MESFPFIVGCGRSGTTLIRAMLDSHPMLAVPPESHFIPSLARRRAAYLRGGDILDAERFVSDLRRHPRFRRWSLPPEDVLKALAESSPTNIADAIRIVFHLYAARQGKSRYGDKTPRYVLKIGSLAELFPEARFIHIIRDGRDVALSLLDIGGGRVEDAALYWRRHVVRGRTAGTRLGPDRYREVRYEDLVADPESRLRSLCEFLDLRFEDSMLRYFERASDLLPGMGDPRLHQRLRLPPTSGLRDWQRQMSADDSALFDVLAGDLLTELGYERAARVPRRVRLKAPARFLGVQGRRLRRRTAALRQPRRSGHAAGRPSIPT